jgi:hypothetical protein
MRIVFHGIILSYAVSKAVALSIRPKTHLISDIVQSPCGKTTLPFRVPSLFLIFPSVSYDHVVKSMCSFMMIRSWHVCQTCRVKLSVTSTLVVYSFPAVGL